MFDVPKIDLSFDSKQRKKQNTVNPRNLVFESYDPLNIKPTNPNVKIRFAESVSRSINIEGLQFTNKLPTLEEAAMEPYIEQAFNLLKNDSDSIKVHCEPVRYSGKHQNRIKSILCNYLDEEIFELHTDYYRKSDVRTGILLRDRGAFRVISLYQVEPKMHRKQKNSKHYLIVLCIDPYHLFIPSKDYGTEIYEQVKDFSHSIEDKYPELG